VANSTDSLDLYAKVEDLLGVKEAAPSLYAHYLLFLNTIDFDSLLDVGCGSGDFLRQMDGAIGIPNALGLDLSPLMVARTQALGYEAQCTNLCDVTKSYDVITAVYDMLNYLTKTQLALFLSCVYSRLNDGGYFICDINTLYGLEEVAVGSFITEDETRFVTIDSEYEKGVYTSEFTLFEKENTCYHKSQETIKQYYHTLEDIVQMSGLELISDDDVYLYELEESDKVFVVLKK